MIRHTFQKRVRYGETDQMGYLYYGNYAQYYEIGRVELIRSLGITYKQMETEYNIWMPVVSMEVRYLRPAFYDELLTIQTTLNSLPKKYIDFYVELFNEDGKLLNGGHVRLCFVDAASKKTVPCPEFLMTKLRPYFEASEV